MIVGIGMDLVEVGRVAKEVSRRGESFLREFLSEQEIADCGGKREPIGSYAARFAAKEAFAKALGTGMLGTMSWHDVRVQRDGDGRPELVLSGAALREADARGIANLHLSLTHEQDFAGAVVVLEGAEQGS